MTTSFSRIDKPIEIAGLPCQNPMRHTPHYACASIEKDLQTGASHIEKPVFSKKPQTYMKTTIKSVNNVQTAAPQAHGELRKPQQPKPKTRAKKRDGKSDNRCKEKCRQDPQIENEMKLQTTRQKLQEFLDHPSRVALGEVPGIDIENEPVYISNGREVIPTIALDKLLESATHLSKHARLGLEWALGRGPMCQDSSPHVSWFSSLGWDFTTCHGVMEELQLKGHVFEVVAREKSGYRNGSRIWKFSACPCLLPAAELKDAVFTTCMPQFSVDGLKVLPTCFSAHRKGEYYLGKEIALFNGVIPPSAKIENATEKQTRDKPAGTIDNGKSKARASKTIGARKSCSR